MDEARGGRQIPGRLAILAARGRSFTVHPYHEDAFSIYRGSGSPPDPSDANQPLIELLTTKLRLQSVPMGPQAAPNPGAPAPAAQ